MHTVPHSPAVASACNPPQSSPTNRYAHCVWCKAPLVDRRDPLLCDGSCDPLPLILASPMSLHSGVVADFTFVPPASPPFSRLFLLFFFTHLTPHCLHLETKFFFNLATPTQNFFHVVPTSCGPNQAAAVYVYIYMFIYSLNIGTGRKKQKGQQQMFAN